MSYPKLLMSALDADATVLDAVILPADAGDQISHALALRKLADGSLVVHTCNLEGVTKPGEVSYFWGHYFKTEPEARSYFNQKRAERLAGPAEAAPAKPSTLPLPEATLDAIEAQWISRARAQAFKPGTKAYSNAEREFFVGAMAALQDVKPECFVPPRWVMLLMSGRPVIAAGRILRD